MRADAVAERARLIAKALPARLALLNAAGAPPAAEAADKKPNEVSEMLHFLALQRWLHQQAKYRNTYWARSENHECTEDMR